MINKCDYNTPLGCVGCYVENGSVGVIRDGDCIYEKLANDNGNNSTSLCPRKTLIHKNITFGNRVPISLEKFISLHKL